MTEAITVLNEYRAQQWAALIQEYHTSGLTNPEFCQQRGISEKSYYCWPHKLRNQLAESVTPQLIRLESMTSSASVSTEGILSIQFRGAELRLPCKVDSAAVAAMLQAIRQCDSISGLYARVHRS